MPNEYDDMSEEERLYQQAVMPPDHGDASDKKRPSLYCRGCGYDLKYLPPGRCPECGARFHPEDLQTVSTSKPLIVSKVFSWSYEFAKKLLAWFFVAILVLGAIAAFIMLIGNISGMAPNR